VTLLTAVGCLLVGVPPLLRDPLVAAVVLSITSHLVADGLTPMGIEPLRPLTDRRFAAPRIVRVRSRSPVANTGLFLAGFLLTAGLIVSATDRIVRVLFRTAFDVADGTVPTLTTPTSPAEWRALLGTVLDTIRMLTLAFLRFEYAAPVIILVMLAVGVVVISKA